jgi:glycosyltransferase involved in cell wall biosynthesis
MRILDVGAHDGFVGAWLLKQRPDVEIDGLELHPRGVEECRRRGYHKVAQGAAEEADELFTPGSYDAVMAFELLEHVPDMDGLLSVLERMLTPDGVIYLSTPDGCFGEGANPHHLRALRSIDLAELLRRRGTLQDMGVGADGICVAAYKPRSHTLGELAIHTGPGWQRWSPLDIESKGLGGSETAAVKVADALSELGWVVTVYGDVEQGVHGNVVYRHVETFDPLERRDVFISSRYPELFDRPINARFKALWAHDTDFGDRLTPERASRIDDVLCLSGWQQMNLVRLYPFLDDRIQIIRNGIDLSLFNSNGSRPKRHQRVLYTSSPDRGLDVLLELWPRIRKRVPRAKLAYAYAPVYYEIAKQDPVVGAHAALIEKLSRQKGVENLGSLSQPDLAEVMRQSLVWTAPSYNTPHQAPFFETSCIGAMEAQAAGLHVVASAWGALTETVTFGDLIDAEPASEQWKDRLVAGIVDGLTHRPTQEHAQMNGPLAAAELGWDGVAEQITQIAQASPE